jgi:uncharacterized protein (TIGR02246 family)
MPLSAEDQLAIADLLNRLNFAVDDRDPDAWAACFTPDGTFENPEGVHKGPDAQRKLIEAEFVHPRRMHFMTDLLIDGNGDQATARANGTVFEDNDGTRILNFSRQEHHLVRVDGKWLIQRTIRHRPKRAS